MSRRARLWCLAALGVVIVIWQAALVTLVSRRLYLYRPASELAGVLTPASDEDAGKLRAEAREASRALAALRPRSVHVVVDTANNRLYLKKGEEILLEAPCSTGSGGLLKDPETGRQWVFETPRGMFRVHRKARDPVWTKPDWAFIEEGKPLPEKWSERRDFDTLGDYALYFGDGYMIHGTLYQRYLGRAITHGCVRLGDEDLALVYEKTPVGAPIYIF